MKMLTMKNFFKTLSEFFPAKFRGIFRILSKIYDGIFLQKN